MEQELDKINVVFFIPKVKGFGNILLIMAVVYGIAF